MINSRRQTKKEVTDDIFREAKAQRAAELKAQARLKAERKARRLFPRFSLQIRVVFLIMTLGIMAASGAAYVSYNSSMETAIATAESRGRVMFDVIAAAREQFRTVTKPKFMEIRQNKAWIPELQSGFYMLRGVTDRFRERTDEMSFKQAARNPLHLPNKADAFDISVIEQFEKDPSRKSVSGTIIKDGKPYYFYSEPFLVTHKSCLKCHGKPEDAPAKQRNIYGSSSGYGWKMNEVAAASIVYVPLTPAIEAATKQSQRLIVVIVASISIIALALWIFIKYWIIDRLNRVCTRAKELATATNLDVPLKADKDDEIGDLMKAFESMRKGIKAAFKRIYR